MPFILLYIDQRPGSMSGTSSGTYNDPDASDTD